MADDSDSNMPKRPTFVTREDLGEVPAAPEPKRVATTPDTEPRPTASGWTSRPEVYPATPTAPVVPAEPVAAGPYDPQPGEFFDKRDFGRLPRRSGPLRRIAIVAALLLVAGVLGKSAFDRWYDNQITWSQAEGDEVSFRIEDGWTLNQVADELESLDVVKDAFWFRRWCNGKVDESVPVIDGIEPPELCDFQAGNYFINTYLPFDRVAAILGEGPEAEVFFKVNIPEGLTLDEIGPRLVAQNPQYSLAEINEALDNSFIESLLVPDDLVLFGVEGFRHSLEGLLFPATYDIGEDEASDEVDILTRMARTMEDRFEALAADGLPPVALELGLSEYQTIIIASMIEEEAKIAADRPKIARVIYNRLLAGEQLGIDATTRYAVNKAPGEPLLESDLASLSPYNTRAVTGIPPTPIAAPGADSLRAALNPEDGDWFYYVLTNENDVAGAHTFAVTASDFEAARQICIQKDLGCG